MPLPRNCLRFLNHCVGFFLLVLSVSATSSADEATHPVILEGRESAIEQVFAPYVTGQEVAPGWHLGDLHVSRTMVVADLLGPGETATLRLSMYRTRRTRARSR